METAIACIMQYDGICVQILRNITKTSVTITHLETRIKSGTFRIKTTEPLRSVPLAQRSVTSAGLFGIQARRSSKPLYVHWHTRLSCCAPNTLCLNSDCSGRHSVIWLRHIQLPRTLTACARGEGEREKELAGRLWAVVYLPHSATFWGPLQ
jgi:hypothetical protein